MHIRRALLAALILTFFGVGTTRADVIGYSGTTAGGPTFNRPLEDGSGLSAVGTAVPYSVYQFTVSAAGAGLHNFLSLPTTPGFDNFLILYQNAFNPASPLTNFLVADDDTGGIGVSAAFTWNLSAGTNYYLVTTGFNNSDFGNFTNTISSAVPEPATMILLGTGLAAIAGRKLRRRRG